MKHAEHIVAFHKATFGELPCEGFNFMSQQEFSERAASSLIIAQRAGLETNEEYAQLLPYISLYTTGPDGKTKVFAYQRGKGVGESRLAGNYSVGVGGHVDIGDVRFRKNIIDFEGTLADSWERELDEEISFTEKGGERNDVYSIMRLWGIKARFIGIINDNSDAVGRVHYGALFSMEIPHSLTPRCIEPELVTLGVVSPHELKGLPLENWSKIVLDVIAESEAF